MDEKLKPRPVINQNKNQITNMISCKLTSNNNNKNNKYK